MSSLIKGVKNLFTHKQKNNEQKATSSDGWAKNNEIGYVLTESQQTYEYHCSVQKILANVFIKDIFGIIDEYCDKKIVLLTEYLNWIMIEHKTFNEHIKYFNRFNIDDTNFICKLLKLNNPDFILYVIDILVNTYKFDLQLFTYSYRLDQDTEIEVSFLHVVFMNNRLYDEKFLDTLIYKYKYDINVVTLTKYQTMTLVNHLLTDILNNTYLKKMTPLGKEWIIKYLKSRGASTINYKLF